MHWHRLEKEKTAYMISAISIGADVELFGANSEAKCARLPFYPNHLFYRLTNYASLPTFSMDFLSDGNSFIYLDGTEKPLLETNLKAGLILNKETVLPYLHFYFLCVRNEDGDILILKDRNEAATVDMFDDERREDFSVLPNGAGVEFDEELQCFFLTCPIYYLGTLMEAAILVDKAGLVIVRPHKMVMADLPQQEAAEQY